MSRLARGHVESRLRERFPGGDVTVEVMDGGGLWIAVHARAGSLVMITSEQPGGVLAALLAPGRQE
jgi:hypothetical protein